MEKLPSISAVSAICSLRQVPSLRISLCVGRVSARERVAVVKCVGVMNGCNFAFSPLK